jgi:hypothetical protein
MPEDNVPLHNPVDPVIGKKLTVPDHVFPRRKLLDLEEVHKKNQVQQAVSKSVTTTTTKDGASTPTPSGTPAQLLSVSAVESPTKVQAKTVSLVSVTFTRDTSDSNFGGMRVWLTGYKGTVTPVIVAEGTQSPINFLLETTGETVTITGQAVGTSGVPADFVKSPTCTVLLDGVISAPPGPTIAQSLIPTPTGYQFQFNQLAGLTADVIDSYRVYRNTANNSATATLLVTYKNDPTNVGAIVVSDDAQFGESYFYWVTAVNTSGLESTKVAAQSGAVAGHAATAQLVVSGLTTLSTNLPNPSVSTDWTASPNTIAVPVTGLEFDVFCDGSGNSLLEVLLRA